MNMTLFNIKKIYYRNRLILYIGLSFIGAMLAAGFYAFHTFSKTTLEGSKETIDLLAENYADNISSIIRQDYHLTNMLAAAAGTFVNADNNLIATGRLTDMLEAEKLPNNIVLSEAFLLRNTYISQDREEEKGFSEDFRIFMHRQNEGVQTEHKNSSVEQNFLIPQEVSAKQTAVFQTPQHIQLAGQRYHTYAVIAPIVNNGQYLGYLRLFFSTNHFQRLTDKPMQYRGHTKFFLVSENDNFISVSNKNYLAGRNVKLANTIESLIYDAIQQGNEHETVSDKVIGFSKVRNDFSAKQWLLVAYISNKQVIKSLVRNIISSIFIAAFILLIGLAFTVLLSLSFFKTFEKLIKQAEVMTKGGKIYLDTRTDYPEINKLSSVLNKIIKRREDIYKTAEAIEQENYFRDVEPISDLDFTAHAINKINRKLQEIESFNRKQQKENEIRNWQRKGQLEISEIQRTGTNETDILSFKLIRAIVKYTNALLGAIYVKRKGNSGEAELHLTGAYAYEEKRSLDVKFKLGEGIIGTCAVEKKKIFIDDLPDNYIRIGSGMGSSKPGFLGVFPIFIQEKLVAVCEIGFMQKPEAYILNFIEQLSENIGAWISAAENQRSSQKLLKLSQDKTRELSEKEAELDSMLNAINRTVITVQYAPDGEFISANDLYYKITGYTPNDLEGSNVLNLVKDGREELEKIIDTVKKGESVEQTVTRYKKTGETISIKATYSPYYDSKGKITRVIFFGIDNTNK